MSHLTTLIECVRSEGCEGCLDALERELDNSRKRITVLESALQAAKSGFVHLGKCVVYTTEKEFVDQQITTIDQVLNGTR